MVKTIYVKDDQLWSMCKTLAEGMNLSMSAAIDEALRDWFFRKTGIKLLR